MGISVGKSCRLHFPPLQPRFRGTQLHSLSSTSSITPLSSSPSPLPPNPKSILLDIFSAFIPHMLKKKKKPSYNATDWSYYKFLASNLNWALAAPHLWEFPSSHSLQQLFHTEKTHAINRSHVSTSLHLSSNHCWQFGYLWLHPASNTDLGTWGSLINIYWISKWISQQPFNEFTRPWACNNMTEAYEN